MMSKIYVYTRVSTKDQADALAQQDRVAMEEAQIAKIRHPHATEIVGPLADQASAFKIPFHKRPMGRLICEMLRPNDIVVFSRLDRFVRLGKDFELQFEEWNKLGITIIFADLKVDMSTAAGGMVARMFAAFAQYFSESLSERQKASWRERYVHGTKFHNKNKILVRKVKRADGSHITVPNRAAIVYLRFIVFRRRYSALKNGVPDSWQQCCDDLERARVTHGDILEYRPDHKREQWRHVRIRYHVQHLLMSELPALNSERLVKYFRDLPNPFQLGRKPDGKPRGYKHRPRQRDTIYDFARSIEKPLHTKPPKRWATHYDCCQDCQRTDFQHFARGRCVKCYKAMTTSNDNGQPTEAA